MAGQVKQLKEIQKGEVDQDSMVSSENNSKRLLRNKRRRAGAGAGVTRSAPRYPAKSGGISVKAREEIAKKYFTNLIHF